LPIIILKSFDAVPIVNQAQMFANLRLSAGRGASFGEGLA